MSLFSFDELFGHITPSTESTWHGEIRMGSMGRGGAQHVLHLKIKRQGPFFFAKPNGLHEDT